MTAPTRARGSNALASSAFEATPAVVPAGGANWFAVPFVSHSLGEERPLIASDLLGQGREMSDPTPDVATNDGDIVVPVDVRNFGRWLKLFLGTPASTGAPAKASDVLTFTGNVANGDTVTLGTRTYTFQTALTAVPGNVKIGSSLTTSIANLYNAINGTGGVPGTDYAATSAHPSVVATAKDATTMTVNAVSGGVAGNSIAATETSTAASWGTATLSGGAVATHVFTSGSTTLPSLSIEIGAPEVPAYSTHYCARGNQLKIGLTRSGLLNATASLICVGETAAVAATVNGGSPTVLPVTRFPQATGFIKKDGLQLASVVSADITISNQLEKVETIKSDGRIEDADPGQVMVTGSVTVKFADTTLLAAATASPPVPLELSLGWTSGDFSLVFDLGRTFLPLAKRPITGPNGIQAQFNFQVSGQGGHAVVATLINDLANYSA